jgi:hypothetical protein
MMSDVTKRSILRCIHIVFAIPIAGYVYSPFKELPNYALWFGSSPFLLRSLRDFGCGKATSFDDLFRKDRPVPSPAGPSSHRWNASVTQ